MGHFSEIQIDVQSMAHDMGDDFGFDPQTIATIARHFDLSKAEVISILSDDCDDDSYDEYDGQPDEAQEWHDFDPDC